MVWGNFHALALLLAIFSAVALIGFSPRRPTFLGTLKALALGLVASLVSLTFSMHMCESGTPFTQWALPNLGLVAVLAASQPSRRRSAAAVALALGGFVLSFHYSALVHEPGYFGHAQADSYDRDLAIAPFWHSPLTGLYKKTHLKASLEAPLPDGN